ncbi:hypothetical protein HanRHA438_Chr00c23g0853451 [Helianthus annuus]|nr:hypothetical protein HanRHA438_Chr00c23g0853451 [Helianthus annuus]
MMDSTLRFSKFISFIVFVSFIISFFTIIIWNILGHFRLRVCGSAMMSMQIYIYVCVDL